MDSCQIGKFAEKHALCFQTEQRFTFARCASLLLCLYTDISARTDTEQML